MQARDTWSAAATLPSAVTRSLMIELDARLSMIMAGGGSVAAKSSMSNATNKPSAPRSSVPCSSTSAAASRTPTPSTTRRSSMCGGCSYLLLRNRVACSPAFNLYSTLPSAHPRWSQ
jgi:hypothetical protein